MTEQVQLEKEPSMEPPAAAALGVTRRRRQANGAVNEGKGGQEHDWRAGAYTAAALQHEVFPPIKWAVPLYVPEGLTLLAGRPKSCKSWMVADWSLGIAGNEWVMHGIKPAMVGDVLYLALEDNKRRLQDRITKLIGANKKGWPERLTVKHSWRRLDKGGMEDLEGWCKSVNQPSLIVIDTLQKVRPVKRDNGYAEDYDALTVLQELAGKYGVAIVVVHHTRKMEAEDPFDTISGTLGLVGSADTILVIEGTSQGMTLHGRGRDIASFEKAVQFDAQTWRWRILGEAEVVRRSETRNTILDALKGSSDPMTPSEIADETALKRDVVKHRLAGMVKAGEASKVGPGKYVAGRADSGDGVTASGDGVTEKVTPTVPPVTVVTPVTLGQRPQ